MVAWFLKMTAVGTDDPMNLEGGPTRGGRVLEGFPSLMPVCMSVWSPVSWVYVVVTYRYAF